MLVSSSLLLHQKEFKTKHQIHKFYETSTCMEEDEFCRQVNDPVFIGIKGFDVVVFVC